MRARTSHAKGLRRALTFAVLIAAIAQTPAAHAQGQHKVAAEALFDEGRKLMAQRKPALACPKFADSQRLDPSPSTLLNLASCYEKLGKSATAWATYKEAASLAYAQNRQSLVTIATKHANALEPTLSRLAVRVSEPAPGLTIKADGVQLGDWGLAIPMDPGTHRLEATAPNKQPWSTMAEVPSGGETLTVTVPALEDAPSPPTLTSAEVPAAPPRTMPASEPMPHAGADETSRGGTQRTIGIVTGAAGLAGIATGTVFLVIAKSKYDDSRDHCPADKNLCTPEGVSLRDDARSAGNIATIAYGIGAAALAAGVVLWITAPSHEARRGSIGVSPTASGLLVQGRF